MPLPASTNNIQKIASIINTPGINQIFCKLSHGCDVIYVPEREIAIIESSLNGNMLNSINPIKMMLDKTADIVVIHIHLRTFLFNRNLLRKRPIANRKGTQKITPIIGNIAIIQSNSHDTDKAIPKGMANKTPAAATPKNR